MSEHGIVPLERLSLAPEAMQLAVRGWLEIQERGYGEGRGAPPFSSDTQALAAIVTNGQEKMLGGILTFSQEPQLSRIWVDLSYVPPEFRGIGVYRALWDALVSIAAHGNIATIESATSTANTAMRAVAKKLHREEKAVYLVYRVNP